MSFECPLSSIPPGKEPDQVPTHLLPTTQASPGLNPDNFNSLIQLYQSKLSILKSSISSLSTKLISHLNSHTKDAVHKICQIEEKLSNLSKSPSDKILFYLTQTLNSLPNFDSNYQKTFEAVSNTFEFKSIENFPVPQDLNSDFLIYFNQHTGQHGKIDLEKFTLSQSLTYPKFECSFNSGCLLKYGLVFLNGGSTNYEARNETCLFDFCLDKVEKLEKSEYLRSGSTCVCKNGKVFAFGSTYPVSKQSEVFDLKAKRWAKISMLPQIMTFCTSSCVNRRIFVSGARCNGIWEYDDEKDSFDWISCEMTFGYKAICENFILINGYLVEMTMTGSRIIFTKYKSDWIASPLEISMCVRKAEYIFFLDTNLKLMRINTQLKAIEAIEYN